jgi:outer membrane protein OmpA-like peptidoglycan-associated protein
MIKAYCFLLFSIASFKILAQSSPSKKSLPKGYYLVIAAFSPTHEDYAIRLSAGLNKDGRHTAYGFETIRKYWYVYLDQLATLEECINECKKIRNETPFADAWVHEVKGSGGSENEPVVTNNDSQEQAKEMATIPAVAEPSPAKDAKPDSSTANLPEQKTPEPITRPLTLKNTQTFLSLYNSTTNEAIDGEVEVVNAENGKLISRVKGNAYVNLPNPGTKSGKLTLINNTFGYRKEQLEINYNEPEKDTVKQYITLTGKNFMIRFGLVKIHKGDISTLYNVYFFNDAAIMLPDSKYQLTSLLQMMKENQNMKIILHGHTNGGGRGKIIYMGPSKEFFGMAKDVVNGSGSAKELSQARAETIRQWLISQGVEESRITIKGWGGSRMIYDKDSPFNRKNIRVDVEVAED